MASYSQQVKTEICAAKPVCRHCARALCYGMLLCFRGAAARPGVEFRSENPDAARLLTRLLADLFGAIVTMADPDLRPGASRPVYSVTVDNPAEAEAISRHFFPNGKRELNPDFFPNECCRLAFLRGAYLACGSVTDPEKEYHLEFCLADEQLRDRLAALWEGFDLHFRQARRLGTFLLYVKESEQLADVLARLGAVRAPLGLWNLKIEKGLRNQVNRVTNCESANIGKTVNAAQEQIPKIMLLKEWEGFCRLPGYLREAAELRLLHPDFSMKELADLAHPPLTRAGFHHRIQKLCALADQWEKEEPEL